MSDVNYMTFGWLEIETPLSEIHDARLLKLCYWTSGKHCPGVLHTISWGIYESGDFKGWWDFWVLPKQRNNNKVPMEVAAGFFKQEAMRRGLDVSFMENVAIDPKFKVVDGYF